MTVLTSAAELLAGFDREELLLDYQLISTTSTQEARGVEALMRWEHPTRGLLLPAEFLPLMTCGLGSAMVRTAVTRFSLVEAIGQAGVWRSEGHDIPVSVNVAPSALIDDWVPGCIADLLAREGLPAHRLTVEVTERLGKISVAALAPAFAALSALGVRLSLDDFGTGDASLSLLRTVPFDEIKIDQSFVANVCTQLADHNIIEFTVRLADSLGMTVVAEGVENRAALNQLADIGSGLAQGNYLHRPTGANDVPLLFGGLAVLDLRAVDRMNRRREHSAVR